MFYRIWKAAIVNVHTMVVKRMLIFSCKGFGNLIICECTKEQIVTSSSIIFLEARFWLFFIFPYIPYIRAFAIPKIPKDLYIYMYIYILLELESIIILRKRFFVMCQRTNSLLFPTVSAYGWVFVETVSVPNW